MDLFWRHIITVVMYGASEFFNTNISGSPPEKFENPDDSPDAMMCR